MTEGTNDTLPPKKRQFTEETHISLTDPFEVDEVFFDAMADTDLMRIKYGEDDDFIECCEIDPASSGVGSFSTHRWNGPVTIGAERDVEFRAIKLRSSMQVPVFRLLKGE